MNKASIIVLSGDLDKVIAAFNIAIGAESSGMGYRYQKRAGTDKGERKDSRVG